MSWEVSGHHGGVCTIVTEIYVVSKTGLYRICVSVCDSLDQVNLFHVVTRIHINTNYSKCYRSFLDLSRQVDVVHASRRNNNQTRCQQHNRRGHWFHLFAEFVGYARRSTVHSSRIGRPCGKLYQRLTHHSID